MTTTKGALRVRRQTSYPTDGVTYMSDTLGLHRVGNAHPSETAVSLHLYTVSSLNLCEATCTTRGHHSKLSADHNCYA
jgi:hypothetical protein